jgi:DNA mismatch endonuclease (patch repair protein)
MSDVFSPEKRSWIMSRIKGLDTKPELKVRKLVHGMGYRFRLRSCNLPGKPDITLPKYKKVIFVNGCFWHGHNSCKRAKKPSSNIDFWEKKINSNKKRDHVNSSKLKKMGWQVLVIWQCETKNNEKLCKILENYLIK